MKAKWIGEGKSRKTVNEYAARVKLAYKWAAAHSLVPAAVYAALRLVESEAKGRTKAKEPAKKRSVPAEMVEKTIPHLHKNTARQRVLAALVRAQLYGGMRPADLDRSDPAAWKYDVGRLAKTLHLDK